MIALNKIQILPSQVGNLVCLDQLDARENELREVPIELQSLTSLGLLALSGNKIPASLNPSLQQIAKSLTRLKCLELDQHNRFT